MTPDDPPLGLPAAGDCCFSSRTVLEAVTNSLLRSGKDGVDLDQLAEVLE
jgi:hypothetical protein